MSSSPDSSPFVLPRPVRDQFVSVLCSFCRKGSTSYRCQVLLDNGDFVLNGERVCGRPFCSDCAEEAGIDGNRTRCPRHLFGDVIDSGVINPPLMSRAPRSSSSSASGVDAAPVDDSNQSVGQSNPAVPSGDASNVETARNPQQENGRVRSEDDPCLNSQHGANSDPAMSPQNPELNTNNDASVPTSSSQPTSFNDFEVYAIGQIYEREAFVNEVKCAAHKSGFEVAIRGPRILCSRACRGSDGPKAAAKKAATPVEKKRKKSSHTVGCSWVIRWVKYTPADMENPPPHIRITHICLEHTNGCNPSPQQLRLSKRRSGTYTRNIPLIRLKEAVLLLGAKEKISYSLVRRYLKNFFPPDWVMDSASICNFLVKCRVFKQELESRDDTLSIDQDVPGWIEMANTDPVDFISKASRVAADMLMETLNNPSDIWEVEQYLENLKKEDAGFDYRISRQCDGRPTGIVWVTSAMRYNYEVGGFCIFLDAMKRQQNNIDWPYISVVVLNNMKKVANACEALTCAERLDGYR